MLFIPERQDPPTDAKDGAARRIHVSAPLASPLLEDISGRYFEDCNEAQQVMKRPTDFTWEYAAYAVDPANAERLWDEIPL